jgi:exocyst complex component 3
MDLATLVCANPRFANLDLRNSMPNLLTIHCELSQLNEFRDQAMYQGRNSEDVKRTLKRYFESLDKVTEEFESCFWDLTRALLDIIRCNNPTLVVKIAKIIELEERLDEKSVAVQEAKSHYAELANKFRSIRGSPRKLRLYYQRFEETVDQSVQEMFEQHVEKYGEDFLAMLENLDWIYDDLRLIREEVVPCMPPKWKMFEVYVKYFHKLVYDTVKNIVASEPDAATIIKILEWIKMYKSTMYREMGIAESKLVPALLDGKESTLIDDYLHIIVRKVEEWMDNLANTEKKEFMDRTASPDEDADGKYMSGGASIMFQMISQQIDVAADSGQGRVLVAVVEECVRVIKNRQTEWTELLQSEAKRQIDTPEDVPNGLVEYTMALANDQVLCADYTEAILGRTEPLVSSKYKAKISNGFNQSIDGFLDLAKFCMSIILEIVFNDLKPPLSSIFTSAWYGGSDVSRIIATLKEYTEDFQAHLNDYLFETLMEDMVVQFLKAYMGASRNKQTKFKMPAAIDQIRNDVRLAYGFFSQYIPGNVVQDYFRIFELVMTILSATKISFSADMDDLMAIYWDTPSWYEVSFNDWTYIRFVEGLINNRDDLDRTSSKELLALLRARPREIAGDREPTFMAKL